MPDESDLHVSGSLDQSVGSQVVPAAAEPRTLYRPRKASQQPLVNPQLGIRGTPWPLAQVPPLAALSINLLSLTVQQHCRSQGFLGHHSVPAGVSA